MILTGLSYWLAGFAVRPVKQAWQEQTQFISDASHELKTPLTVILSSSELAAGEPDEAKTKQYIDNIHAESLRMKELVEDMLALARAESGGLQVFLLLLVLLRESDELHAQHSESGYGDCYDDGDDYWNNRENLQVRVN